MTTPAPVRNQHPEDVKAAVRKRGTTLKNLALQTGLSESACRMALLEPVPAANRAIAEFLQTSVDRLWPEWFDSKGRRRKVKPSVKSVAEPARG